MQLDLNFFYEIKYSNETILFNGFQVQDSGRCDGMCKDIHGTFIMYLNN